MDTNGSVSGGVKYEWGGDKDENQFSAWGKVEAHDDNGNKVEVTVEQNSDGTGSVSANGTKDFESKDKDK
jgi:hypothetical protein